MPTCTCCLVVKAIDQFADAQLVGKGKCLQCSNPRLAAKMLAEGLEQQPLADLGRSRVAGKRPAEQQMRDCSACRRKLPVKSFSSRQLSSQGKGRCKACASQACIANITEQSKRRREEDEHLVALDNDDSEEERYVDSLLWSVSEARKKANDEKQKMEPPAGLDKSNVGHRLLTRLGWQPGTALGMSSTGEAGLRDKEPWEQTSQLRSRRGLGAEPAEHCVASPDELPSTVVASARAVYPEELSWSAEADDSNSCV